MPIVVTTASSGVEEFFNRSHSKTDGKFASSGTGGGHYGGRGAGKKQTSAQKHQPGGAGHSNGDAIGTKHNEARAKEMERVQRGPAPPAPGAAAKASLKGSQKERLQKIMEKSPHAPPKPGERVNEHTKNTRGPVPPKPGEAGNKAGQAKYDAAKKAFDSKQAKKADYTKRGPTPPKPGEAGGKTQEKYNRQRKVWASKSLTSSSIGPMSVVSITASSGVEEFFNKNHAKTSGRFVSGAGGGTGASGTGTSKAASPGTATVKVKSDWHNANHALNEKVSAKMQRQVVKQVGVSKSIAAKYPDVSGRERARIKAKNDAYDKEVATDKAAERATRKNDAPARKLVRDAGGITKWTAKYKAADKEGKAKLLGLKPGDGKYV